MKYMGNPTHSLVNPSLMMVFLKQSKIPEYSSASGVCFCNFILILSAGRERNAVSKEAKTAETFGRKIDCGWNRGLIRSVMISLPAICPTLINSTRSIVILSPLQSPKML